MIENAKCSVLVMIFSNFHLRPENDPRDIQGVNQALLKACMLLFLLQDTGRVVLKVFGPDFSSGLAGTSVNLSPLV